VQFRKAVLGFQAKERVAQVLDDVAAAHGAVALDAGARVEDVAVDVDAAGTVESFR
jgi:hypothetical protein